jgi:hypothetical protein
MSEEEISRKIITTLTLGQIEDEAIADLWKIFLESYNYLREKGLRASAIFERMYDAIKGRKGIIDAWLDLILLTTFAAGIASVEKRKIKSVDVDKTTKDICYKWPECPEKRISKVMEILGTLIEWYDLTQR